MNVKQDDGFRPYASTEDFVKDHCVNTHCLVCETSLWPDCEFLPLKQQQRQLFNEYRAVPA